MAIFILVISLWLIFFILLDFRVMKKEQESIDEIVEFNQKLNKLNVNLKKLNKKNLRLPRIGK